MTRFDIINDLELSHPNLCNLFGGHISDPDPEFKIKQDAEVLSAFKGQSDEKLNWDG